MRESDVAIIGVGTAGMFDAVGVRLTVNDDVFDQTDQPRAVALHRPRPWHLTSKNTGKRAP